jgi:RNA polymerase sigma factor (sigma-70 family)
MTREGGRVLRKLRQILRRDASAGLPDAQLLEGFVARGDDAAFAALVGRHGPMVLAVCQRVLGNRDDAADAFQASFLVLARRAAAIRKPEALSSWLYGVAYRVALKMKATAGQRRQREQQMAMSSAQVPPDPAWQEVLTGLDEEMQRLPEKHRRPLVLCFLEGMSQEEAAALLGWPRGTLRRRLDRGRELLRQRLTRRGLTLGAAAVATLSAARALAVPVTLDLARSLAAAAVLFAVRKPLPAGLLSPAIVALAEGVLKTMIVAKLRFFSLIFLLLTLSTAGAWLYAHSGPDEEVGSAATPQTVPKKPVAIGRVPAGPAPRPASGAKVLDRLADDDYVKSLVFSPDGKTLLCGTARSDGPAHGHVRRWDVLKRRKKPWELSSPAGVEAVAISPGGKLLAMSTAGTRIGGFQVVPGELKLFDASTGALKANLRSRSHSFQSIAFSPDGKTLAGGSPNWDVQGRPVDGGIIRIWSIAAGKEIGILKGHRGLIRSVAFARGSKLLASASFEIPPPGQGTPTGEVKLWDLTTGREKASLKGSGRPVWCVAFSPEGNVLASGGEDGVIHLWDVAKDTEIAALEGHQSRIYALAFSPDGATLASGGGNLSNHPSPGELRLWDVARGKQAAALKEHEVTVTAVAFNHDGTRLASGSHDGRVIVWEVMRAE